MFIISRLAVQKFILLLRVYEYLLKSAVLYDHSGIVEEAELIGKQNKAEHADIKRNRIAPAGIKTLPVPAYAEAYYNADYYGEYKPFVYHIGKFFAVHFVYDIRKSTAYPTMNTARLIKI